MKESILRTKSYAFALDSILAYHKLTEQKEFILSKQYVRSATSVGANIREASNAQSTADFIHKLSISLKECSESQYWLELMRDAKYLTNGQFEQLYPQSKELHKMLSSSILTAKKRLNN
jgi:four helix bundle protein